MDSIRERYRRDPLIWNLVNFLESQIQDLNLTPTEIRECAMLAAIHNEMRNPRPVVVPREFFDAITSRQAAGDNVR